MNYRHAFHAGNFADVHKHSVLACVLSYLRLKPGAFRVIDTHAGAGRYDLLGSEATRSGEWRQGIARIWHKSEWGAAHDLIRPYLDAIAALNPDGALRAYPGSPLIAKSFLRLQDRLIACELEKGAAAALGDALRGDRRCKALTIDGWTAATAYVPPPERRGLVLIDPPFEEAGDFARLADVLATAHRKWPTGTYLLWYPIKDRQAPDLLARQLGKLPVPRMLRSELTLKPAQAGGNLVGSGLVVVNPPFTLLQDLGVLLPVLCRFLSGEARARTDWLAAEQHPHRDR
jgi:23S rRNA (adenine2030-N6)-methyltransferase